MPRHDRTVGSKVRTSQAAERALLVGEELEDELRMGSFRFPGDEVRRQLHKTNNTIRKQQSRKRRGGFGSQRFLQSMRFWEQQSKRRGFTTSKSNSNNNNNNNSNSNSNSNSHNNLYKGSSKSIATTTTNNNNNNNDDVLEYNGGKEMSTRLVVGDITRDLNNTIVQAATSPRLLLNASNNNEHLRQQQKQQQKRRGEVTRLLSMRCEASRSMRRPRTGPAPGPGAGAGAGGFMGNMGQWLAMEQQHPDHHQHQQQQQQSADALNNTVNEYHDSTTRTRTRTRTITTTTTTIQDQTQQQQHHIGSGMAGGPLGFFKKLKKSDQQQKQRLTKSLLRDKTPVIMEDDANEEDFRHLQQQQHHMKPRRTKTSPASPNKRKWHFKKWTKSKSESFGNPLKTDDFDDDDDDDHDDDDDDDDEETVEDLSPALPAHIQLARSQKRQDALYRGSRHLEQAREFADPIDNRAYSTNSSSDGNSILGTDSEEMQINNNSKDNTRFLRKSRTDCRSTRLDVTKNQPLLVRDHARKSIGSSSAIVESKGTNDRRRCQEPSLDSSTISMSPFRHRRKKQITPQNAVDFIQSNHLDLLAGGEFSKHTIAAHSSTANSRSFISKSETKRPSKLLNNQGLSIPAGLADLSDDEDIFYSIQDVIDSTRAEAASIDKDGNQASYDERSLNRTGRASCGDRHPPQYQDEQQQQKKEKREQQKLPHDQSTSDQQRLQKQWLQKQFSARPKTSLGIDPDGIRMQYSFRYDEDESTREVIASTKSRYAHGGPERYPLESLKEEEDGDFSVREHRSLDKKCGRVLKGASLSSKGETSEINISSNGSNRNNYYIGSKSSRSRDGDGIHDSAAGSNKLDTAPNDSHGNRNASFRDKSSCRKALPPNALGSRQHGVRGGLASTSDDEDDEDSIMRFCQQNAGRSVFAATSEDKDDEDTIMNLLSRRWSIESKDSSDSCTVISRPDPPESPEARASLLVRKPDPPESNRGQAIAVGEWWQVSPNEALELQLTHSFCSRIQDSWDEKMENDAIMAMSSTTIAGDSFEHLDCRSVVSEPADIGLGEPLLEECDLQDPTVTPWLMAWDDLALL